MGEVDWLKQIAAGIDLAYALSEFVKFGNDPASAVKIARENSSAKNWLEDAHAMQERFYPDEPSPGGGVLAAIMRGTMSAAAQRLCL